MSKENTALAEALNKYFAPFESTQNLVSDLIVRREHPIEALILLCARLDAIASDSVAEETSSKQAFTKFVTTYGGDRDLFESVSVADLYCELGYHRWLTEGTVTQPGRLHRFSKVDDPILHLLEGAGLPLTLKDCEYLIDTLMRILAKEFRARPRQSLSKRRAAHPARLGQLIETAARRTRLKGVAAKLPKALSPLFESKRISTLLYERFRCESIHGAQVILNEDRFFGEKEPYWEPKYNEYTGTYELIEFPARFLLECLRACIKNYRTHLLARGKISPAIHFHVVEDTLGNLAWLDQELLPEGGDVRLKIGRG